MLPTLETEQHSPPGPTGSNSVATPGYPEGERITLPPIERWEDLPCIRDLKRFHKNGGVDGRGYEILDRMCKIIWAIGHEVEIRKKVKLPRAQRLAKFQHYCDTLLQGALLWKRNMKAQILHVWEVALSLPRLTKYKAFQDLKPKLEVWYEETQ